MNNKDIKKVNKKVKENIEIAEKYTKDIMDLINYNNELTTSDLQGAVMGIVLSLMAKRK